jgi:hypothetical protein
VKAEAILEYWTLTLPRDGQSLTCELFRTAAGLEVRCRTKAETARSEHVSSMADGLNLSEAWRASYQSKGWVVIKR